MLACLSNSMIVSDDVLGKTRPSYPPQLGPCSLSPYRGSSHTLPPTAAIRSRSSSTLSMSALFGDEGDNGIPESKSDHTTIISVRLAATNAMQLCQSDETAPRRVKCQCSYLRSTTRRTTLRDGMRGVSTPVF